VFVKQESLTPLEFDGLRIFDYTAELELGSSFAVIEVPPAAKHVESWSRRSDKYYLITRGEIRFALQHETRTMAAGDFCFVRRGEHFSYSNEGTAPATLVLVHTPSFELDEEVFLSP
jgi:mannose-6-phosphate isomerase-like protein (cupin superfamily)